MDTGSLQQQEFDEKILFYNNEDIINERSLLNHFSKKHKTIFNNHNIEFISKKGQVGPVNQDNFFALVDGDVKIMGLFDGHGDMGHFVSNFAMASMVNYIKNAEIMNGKSFM